MWYRKAQVQAPAAPADPATPVQPVDQTAISGYQTGINNILTQTGKTYLEIITELNNYKSSIASNQSINKETKANIDTILEATITSVTNAASGNLNQPYTPPQPTAPAGSTEEPLDQTNPAARLVIQPGTTALPGAGGLLSRDAIKPRTGPTTPPPPPPPGSPAGAQGGQAAQQQTKPGKTLHDALKEARITNFIFEAMPGNTLPLDERSYNMVLNNLYASKSLNPQAVNTLKSLLAAMGVYLTLDGNVMVFSKQKTEETPKPQSTFDTTPYKDEA
jgi:hypothetical protein